MRRLEALLSRPAAPRPQHAAGAGRGAAGAGTVGRFSRRRRWPASGAGRRRHDRHGCWCISSACSVPMAPLPLHLTEYARDRRRNHRDPTFQRFADIFHHRALSLFYRAWANSRPTVSFDRPERRTGSRCMRGALIGLGMDSLRNRDAMPDLTKLHFAGHLACQTRHAEGLARSCRRSSTCRCASNVSSARGSILPVRDRTRLGERPRNSGAGPDGAAWRAGLEPAAQVPRRVRAAGAAGLPAPAARRHEFPSAGPDRPQLCRRHAGVGREPGPPARGSAADPAGPAGPAGLDHLADAASQVCRREPTCSSMRAPTACRARSTPNCPSTKRSALESVP